MLIKHWRVWCINAPGNSCSYSCGMWHVVNVPKLRKDICLCKIWAKGLVWRSTWAWLPMSSLAMSPLKEKAAHKWRGVKPQNGWNPCLKSSWHATVPQRNKFERWKALHSIFCSVFALPFKHYFSSEVCRTAWPQCCQMLSVAVQPHNMSVKASPDLKNQIGLRQMRMMDLYQFHGTAYPWIVRNLTIQFNGSAPSPVQMRLTLPNHWGLATTL